MKNLFALSVVLVVFNVSCNSKNEVATNVPLLSPEEVTLNLSLLTEFHPLEASAEQVFLDGKLWSANSAEGAIEVFENNQKVSSVDIPQFISRIAPMGSNKLVAYGKMQSPWRFLYTVIDTKTYAQKTYSLASSYDFFPDRFVALPGGKIFASAIPERGVIQYQLGGSARKINVDINTPSSLAVVGNTVYVVEQNGLGGTRNNIVRISLADDSATRLFEKSDQPGYISHLKLSSDGKTLIASVSRDNTILLINTETNQVTRSIAVAGSPWSTEELGKCLVVASEESKQLTFVDKNSGEIISTWDLNPAGDRLKSPGTVSLDPAKGRAYVRSAYPCPTCSQTQSSLWVAEESTPVTFNKCLN